MTLLLFLTLCSGYYLDLLKVRTQVWYTTGGTKVGVMRWLGEARAKFAPHASLIGFIPWHAIIGTKFFHDERCRSTLNGERDVVKYERVSLTCPKCLRIDCLPLRRPTGAGCEREQITK